MAKVLCKLPNASSNINGVKFVSHRDGMISEEIDDAIALQFAEINGYEIHDPKAKKAKKDGQDQQPPANPAGTGTQSQAPAPSDPGAPAPSSGEPNATTPDPAF